MNRRTQIALLVLASAAMGGCDDGIVRPPDELAAGTWGGDRAGIMIDDSIAHAHIHCTYGDFPAPVELDADGRFSVMGDYLLRAYPVAIGPTMPALLSGQRRGNRVTITVVVSDTVETTLVAVGPVTLTFGREPEMETACPICSVPGDRSAMPRIMTAAQDVYFAPPLFSPAIDPDR